MAKSRRNRWIVAVALALVVMASPALPGSAAGAVPDVGTDEVGVDAVEGFSDVPRGHVFWRPITWMVAKQLTSGYSDGTFRPTNTVTRQSLAAFLYRLSGSPASTCSTAPFTDVSVAHPFCKEIKWLAGQGITTGYGDGSYRPSEATSRQSFAVALYRSAGSPKGADPSCASSPFSDVPTTHPFCGEILWAVGQGITEGYADGTFRPGALVSRQSASAFLQRYKKVPVEIDAGLYSTCALLAHGPVRCWGENDTGQVGDGTTTQRNTPTTVSGLKDAVDISVGFGHACAVRRSGQVVCWGWNGRGQLGDGSTTDRSVPTPVVDLTGAVKVFAGYETTCAILGSGALRCWGDNFFGELGAGLGLGNYSAVPVAVPGITDAVDVSPSAWHTCALRASGGVSCWGYNDDGQVGDGTTDFRPQPVAVSGVSTGVAIGGGQGHTCVVLANGSARCWGVNDFYELGDGTTTARSTPVAVSGLSGAVDVDSSGSLTCALLASGGARCWSYNMDGGVGNGTEDNTVQAPAAVSTLGDAIHITTGGDTSCSLSADGALRCWGRNIEGQVGDGTVTRRLIPTPVSGYG